MVLAISSAIKPSPKIFAASPCNHTPAETASNTGMPCVSKPAIKPARTSPEPAVARAGGALQLMTDLPSGAEITVSDPLNIMVF